MDTELPPLRSSVLRNLERHPSKITLSSIRRNAQKKQTKQYLKPPRPPPGTIDKSNPTRVFHTMNVTPLEEPTRPTRYFAPKIHRLIYSNNYWSAPVRVNRPALTAKESDKDAMARAEKLERQEASFDKYRQAKKALMLSGGPPQLLLQHELMMGGHGNATGLLTDTSTDSTLTTKGPGTKKKQAGDSDYINIMALLNHEKLGAIKAAWMQRENEFVDVLCKYLHVEEIGKVKLASNLCRFFEEVDINGDGSMDWNEFTNFIVDAGMLSADFSASDELDTYVKSNVVDKQRRIAKPITRVEYLAGTDELILLQKEQGSFRVLDANTLNPKAKVKGHTDEVFSAEYIDSHGWVVTSGNDRTLRFWNPAQNYAPVPKMDIVSTDGAQLVLKWHEPNQLLYSSDDQNNINTWGLSKKAHFNEWCCSKKDQFCGHSNVVLDLLLLENTEQLASASLDKTIGLWDLTTHEKTITLTGHKMGVDTLAYHSTYNCLFSSGFEHEALVWNPYCSNLICKLKGHYNPIVGLTVVPKSATVVTADSGGIVKVWDIRTFNCVQTLYVEDQDEARVTGLTYFTSIPKYNRLLSARDRLYVHSSMSSGNHANPDVADLEGCSHAFYNSVAGSFLTCSLTTLKVWSETNGQLVRLHRNVVGMEITAMCLDDSKKKIIVGDAGGQVSVLKYLNGGLMKQSAVQVGAREITSLKYMGGGSKQIIATSWDGSIRLYDETQEESLPLLKQFDFHKDEISCSAYSEVLTLFASGSADGHIYLWDYRSHAMITVLLGHRCPVTALMFMGIPDGTEAWPMLVSGDMEGNVCFWVVRPITTQLGKCVLRLVNTPAQPNSDLAALAPVEPTGKTKTKKTVLFADQKNIPVTAASREEDVPINMSTGEGSSGPSTEGVSSTPTPITSLEFWETPNGRLNVFAGDSQGNITQWDLQRAMRRWGIRKYVVEPKATASSSASTTTSVTTSTSSDSMAVPASVTKNQLPPSSSREHMAVAASAAGQTAHKAGSENRSSAYTRYRQLNQEVFVKLDAAAKNQTVLLRPGDVVMMNRWSAHTSGIRTLHLVKDPNARALLSCSFDKTVSLWNLAGQCTGKLQQGNLGDNDFKGKFAWAFAPDYTTRRIAAEANAKKVLECLKPSNKEPDPSIADSDALFNKLCLEVEEKYKKKKEKKMLTDTSSKQERNEKAAAVSSSSVPSVFITEMEQEELIDAANNSQVKRNGKSGVAKDKVSSGKDNTESSAWDQEEIDARLATIAQETRGGETSAISREAEQELLDKARKERVAIFQKERAKNKEEEVAEGAAAIQTLREMLKNEDNERQRALRAAAGDASHTELTDDIALMERTEMALRFSSSKDGGFDDNMGDEGAQTAVNDDEQGRGSSVDKTEEDGGDEEEESPRDDAAYEGADEEGVADAEIDAMNEDTLAVAVDGADGGIEDT